MISSTSPVSPSARPDRHRMFRIEARQTSSWRRDADVPVLPQTLLLAELMTLEQSVDLAALSQLVLSDLGATIQLLRLAGCECPNTEERSARITDCIADLGWQACMEAIAAQPMLPGAHMPAVAGLWSHSRAVAQYARQIAEGNVGIDPEIDPEEAYLVGLCHLIGALPDALGWSRIRSGAVDSTLAGLELAQAWSLPGCIAEYFSQLQSSGWTSPWPEVVRAAHRRAEPSSTVCPAEAGRQLLLLRAV